MAFRFKQRSPLPGFGITFGFTVLYLSLIVLIPLAGLFLRSAELTPAKLWGLISTREAVAAFKLTFGASFAAALANLVLGSIVAWTLVRYRFPGRKLLDAIIDLPFALPTAVSGVALTAVFAPDTGWIGKYLAPLGIKTAYSQLGVFIALLFISLPFVVRTVQPALSDFDPEAEEAAANLGASRWQTVRRIIFPAILPALLTGFALGFARALGEYGSVTFISGNIPYRTEIAPVLIVSELNQFDLDSAAAIAVVLLAASFAVLFAINSLQWWTQRHQRIEV
jgi:sulfate/thiosulfate transport system permease protein